MLYVISAISLLSSVLCLGNTMNKSATRFEKVFFSIMSVVFIIVSLFVYVGVNA